jgi:two-component system, OmpR family, KDP operon response regulator KdpE
VSAESQRILSVEDDPDLQRVLRFVLEDDGYRVVTASSVCAAETAAREHLPDAAIVDLGLPDRDGIELVGSLRTWSPMPIMVLSARCAEEQRLAAFEAGADDYVLKPFSAPELLARVRACLRRRTESRAHAGLMQVGDLSIDPSRRVLLRAHGEEVRLTPLEQRLLETLNRSPNRLITHAQLIREVWGAGCADTRSLRVLLANLRRKLELGTTRGTRIEREVGVGYRLVVEPQPAGSPAQA